METVYKRSEIPDFEMEILAKGEHDVFLKQSFSIANDEVRVFVDDAGFRKISEEDVNAPLKLLGFLENLCLNLRRAENYMLDLDKIEIAWNLLYVNEDGKPLLKYEICEESASVDVKIERLLAEIPQAGTACSDYINISRSKLAKNLSLDRLVTVAGELKREAYYCGYGFM